jgi:hypothetical protein
MKFFAVLSALILLGSHAALATTYNEEVARNPKCRAMVVGEYTPSEAGFVCNITRPNGNMVDQRLIHTCAPSPVCTEEDSITHARESCAAYFNVVVLNNPDSPCYHRTGPR